MNTRSRNNLYRKIQHKGFVPAHVAEVGVYHPESSNIYEYIFDGIKTTLVEPDPESIKRINECFAEMKNVQLHPVAIYNKAGIIRLAQRDASTFVATLEESPAIVNDQYIPDENDTFEVNAVTFDQVDDGTIDLLSIDVEGSEWFVLKNMKSRPAVLSIETHGGIYVNPNLSEIQNWALENNYAILFKDKSDTVFVDRRKIKVSMLDKFKLWLANIVLQTRKTRKILKRKYINRNKKQK